jgi:hypothetical protein
MIDEKQLLDKIMNVSDDEDDVLEWCFFVLTEPEIAACLEKAKQTAAAELRADDPATLLTAVFVKIIVRALRWARLERRPAESKIATEATSSSTDEFVPAPVPTTFGKTDDTQL